jgi:hypothetical protein
MSYETMAALSADETFKGRVTACCQEQALIFKDDGRADIASLARVIIADPSNAAGVFELVCVSPGIKDAADSASVTDGEILAATQAAWPVYAAVLFPQPDVPNPQG